MKLGVRTILVAVAVVLFLLAALTDENYADYVAFGLAAFAASFVIDDFGLGRMRWR